MAKRQRVGGFKIRTKLDDGSYRTQNAGVAFSTDYEGNYSVLFEIDTDKKKTIETRDGSKEVPVRARLAAGKFVDEDGEVIKLDLRDSFINFIAWEDLAKRPPRQD